MSERCGVDPEHYTELFFVSVTAVPSASEDCNVAKLMKDVGERFETYGCNEYGVPLIETLTKFKVKGEPRMISVVVSHDMEAFEKRMAFVSSLGNVVVTSTPVYSYEEFAEFLGVDSSLTNTTSSDLKDKVLYWLEIDVGYQGKTSEELLDIWKAEAEGILTLRAEGKLCAMLYKGVVERKVHIFLSILEAKDLDSLFFRTPLLARNGENVEIKCKRIIKYDTLHTIDFKNPVPWCD